MDASQQDGPQPGPAARGRGGPGAPASGTSGRRAARREPPPEQRQSGGPSAQSGEASAFRRALDAQAETAGLVPSAPHDLTQPIPRVQIGEDEFSFPVAPVEPVFDPAYGAADETRPVGPVPEELAPPSRVPAWLPPVRAADQARLADRGFPSAAVARPMSPAQYTALSHLAPMPEPETAAGHTRMPDRAPFAPAAVPSATLAIPLSKDPAPLDAATALVKPPPGFATIPAAPSPRHSGRSRRDRVLLLVGVSVSLAVLLGIGLMLVDRGTPMNPMAPSALPSPADPSKHALIPGVGASGTATVSPSASPSSSPSPSDVATVSPSPSAAASTQAAVAASPSAAAQSSAPAAQAPAKACTVTFSVNSWSGAYQLDFTVTSTGTQTTRDWSVSLVLPNGQTATEVWKAQAEQIGQTVDASSDSYNGQISPGGTATWGLQVQGGGQPPSPTSRSTDLTCSAQ
jgi:hypothetical protein